MHITTTQRASACVIVLISLVSSTHSQAQTAAASAGSFELRDHLGRDWHNEVVTFPLSPADLKSAEAKRALVGADGQGTAYQLVPREAGQPAQIAFTTDLKSYGTNTYRFTTAAAQGTTDLQIEETAGSIRIFNKLAGIALRTGLADGNAPIESVRLNSGKWVGGSRLDSALPVVSYRASLVARGPVYAEVLCETQFAGGKKWRLRARVEANEPAVVLTEEYAVVEGAAWTLDLSQNFAPDTVLHRFGRSHTAGKVGALNAWKIGPDAEPAFVMEPWLRWSMRDRQGNWFGLYNEAGADLLAVGALRPSVWMNPKTQNSENLTVPVTLEGGKLGARFSLKDGVRHWMLAALDKTACTPDLKLGPRGDLDSAPLPQRYLIKHGDFPLDTVKDYVLDWKNDATQYPRLMLTKAEVAKLRRDFVPDEKLLEGYMRMAINVYNVAGPFRYFLASGDEKLGRRLADFTLKEMKGYSDAYFNQGVLVTLGFAPHQNRAVQTVVNVADIVWAGILTEPERDKLKAEMAFMGYVYASDNYWSPERGYSANPNMTSMVAGYQAQTGMMLLSHPMAKAWADKGLTELKSEMDNWSDTEGGWLETPSYAMASYDFLLGMFLAARNTGHADYLYEPRMKKIGDWFANISTPPDLRAGGIRHMPPIGNTNINQPTGEFGILAYLWKDKDPAFAARMNWMFQQHGSFPESGIGGFSPSLVGYRGIFLDPTIVAKKPDYKSTLYPETGVLLRNGVGDRETQLHLIAGNNHAHYDMDSGSITLWGKGRIVADDFGYYGQAPADDHSMIESPITGGGQSVMRVRAFESDPNFDYVQGSIVGWERRIAFVKDADPMAPSYFVLRDSLEVPAPATWRLWLSAATVQLKPNGAAVTGKEDVDTDIIFALPQQPVLKTEEKTRTSVGLDVNLKYGKVNFTQTGLIATVDRAKNFVAVIYPRLKTQKPPVVTSLAGGDVLKVEHEAGTDYVFLGDRPFAFKQDGIDFQGTSGLVKIRGAQTQVALGEGGRIAAGGKSLQKPAKNVRPLSYNLLENGDIETGIVMPFQSGGVKIALQDGNPSSQGAVPKGRYCMALSLPEDSARYQSVILLKRLYVDTDKTYRLRLKAFTSQKMHLAVGGHATADAHEKLKAPNGETWNYDLGLKGPTQGWQQLETTIGPPGSGAKYIWPAGTLSTTFGFWLAGEKGIMYMDDFALEPVED